MAQKVHLESLRKVKTTVVLPPVILDHETSDSEAEQRLECLDRCLNDLSPENRYMVIEYHKGEKQVKIENRKRLASEFGIALNALRIRVHRIHVHLVPCVVACVEEGASH